VAEELQLSATPVREALSRLAGQGLVEDRRGQGYFTRSLSPLDIADLYRLSLAQLAMALNRQRETLPPREAAVGDVASDPVQRVERLFADWVAEAGGRALRDAHRTLQVQLGPVRRVEAAVFPDLAQEAVELAGADRAERAAGLRRFHGRRIAAADRLYSLLERGPRTG